MAEYSIKTVDGVIDAVGGTSAAARLTKRKPQHVSNWRKEKRIAAQTFLHFKRALSARNLRANPMLWGIEDTKRKKRKAAGN